MEGETDSSNIVKYTLACLIAFCFLLVMLNKSWWIEEDCENEWIILEWISSIYNLWSNKSGNILISKNNNIVFYKNFTFYYMKKCFMCLYIIFQSFNYNNNDDISFDTKNGKVILLYCKNEHLYGYSICYEIYLLYLQRNGNSFWKCYNVFWFILQIS